VNLKSVVAQVEVKSGGGPLGLARAIFSRFNVIDSDGDVTLPGAFDDGSEAVVSAYGHQSWKGALPVGRAVIRSDHEKAWAEIAFFMTTTSGRDTFATIRELGELGEWSYGFDILKSDHGPAPDGSGGRVQFLRKLRVFEVSPVLRGAGVQTQTVEAKDSLLAERQRFLELTARLDGVEDSTGIDPRELAAHQYLIFVRDRLRSG
jgi:hypothetical protein